MSKPVPGDPKFDECGKQLASSIKETVTPRACKNYDLQTAKQLRRVMAEAVVDLDNAIVTKLQQSIGGVRGNL